MTLKAVAWSYLGLYVLITVLDLRDSVRQKYPLLLLASDLALNVAATAGFVLLLLDVPSPALRTVWKFVAPVLVLGMVAISIHDVKRLERDPDPDLTDRENRWAVLIGSVLGIALMVPMLFANIVFAYGRHLGPTS